MTADELPVADGLGGLAAHLAILESPDFTFGEWVPARTDAEGVTQMPWYRFSPQAEAFLAAVGAGGWVTPFDWMTWMASPEGRRLDSSPTAVATASAEDLGHLLTAYVRGERFGDGTLANAYQSGMLTAIARRAAALLSVEDHNADH